MFEVGAITELARQFQVDILAKVIFSFSPDIIMSPLALPRELLDKWVDKLLPNTNGAMRSVLLQLKNRPTFAQQWPNKYRAGLAKGKARVLQLESIRPCGTTMDAILKRDKEVYEWWNEIT